MRRGVKAKKKKEKSKVAPVKPLGVWVWAQCDNAGCQKWRKLPPGTKIDDAEPWFCYMNPNQDMNDCNIPEEEYNMATEAAVYSHPATEEDVDAQSLDPDRAWTPEFEGGARSQKGLQMNGKRQRTPEPRNSARNGFSQAGRVHSAAARPRPHLGSLGPSELLDLVGGSEGPWNLEAPGTFPADGRDGGATSPDTCKTQEHVLRARRSFQKLLSTCGLWAEEEGPEGGAGPSRGVRPSSPPGWLWDDLSEFAPEAAELATRAADLSSAGSYFQEPLSAGTTGNGEEAADFARLALTAAAAVAAYSTRPPGVLSEAAKLEPTPQALGVAHRPGVTQGDARAVAQRLMPGYAEAVPSSAPGQSTWTHRPAFPGGAPSQPGILAAPPSIGRDPGSSGYSQALPNAFAVSGYPTGYSAAVVQQTASAQRRGGGFGPIDGFQQRPVSNPEVTGFAQASGATGAAWPEPWHAGALHAPMPSNSLAPHAPMPSNSLAPQAHLPYPGLAQYPGQYGWPPPGAAQQVAAPLGGFTPAAQNSEFQGPPGFQYGPVMSHGAGQYGFPGMPPAHSLLQIPTDSFALPGSARPPQ